MPSSSFFLGVGAVLSALSATTVATKYDLEDSYQGSNFLDGFNFFNEKDPTNGFVKYLDRDSARNTQLTRIVGADNYLGVDFTTPLNYRGPNGRNSVRIETKKNYSKGLFVVDIKHMPGGICGTWPAFWSLGSGEWPKNGEIDIIEGVNNNNVNKMVLHTDTNCKTNGQGQTGVQQLYDCALDTNGPSGCDVNDVQTNTYGTGFNANGGGVYAMEWTGEFIKMWFFPRSRIPASITAEKPDTAEFGTPNANFQGACDIEKKFQEHRFIFDTTFCGDWAGNVYGDSGCPRYSGLSSMDSCMKFVAENPAAFRQAYWLISSFKTYKTPVIASSSSSVISSSTVVSSSSSSSVVVSSTSASSSSSSTPVSSSSSSVVSSSSSSSSSVIVSTTSSSSSSVITSSSSSSVVSSSASSSVISSSASSSVISSSASSSVISSSASSSVISSSSSSSVVSSSSSSDSSSSIYPTSTVVTDTSSSVYPTSTIVTDTSSSVYPTSSVVTDISSSVYPTSSVVTDTSSSVYPTLSSSSSNAYPTGSSSSSSYGYDISTSTDIYGSYPSSSLSYGSYPSSSSVHPEDYPSSSSSYGVYPSSSSSVHYGGYPVSSSSVHYGEYPSSSSVHYGEYPSSSVHYGQYPSSSSTGYGVYPASSSSVKYGAYPVSSKPQQGTYPSSSVHYPGYPVSSKPVADHDAYPTPKPAYPQSSKPASYVTTTYTTEYVDVCPTGYTTIKTTHTVTYESYPTTSVPRKPSKETTEPCPPGFTVTEKYCGYGCGDKPTTVKVTVPVTQTRTVYEEVSTSVIAYGTPKVYPPGYNNHEQKPSTSTIIATKILTISYVTVPASEKHASYPSSAAPQPVYPYHSVPEAEKPVSSGVKPVYSKPVHTPEVVVPVVHTPTPGNYYGANVTISYGTGTGKPVATKTGYLTPEFTGAASSLKASGVAVGALAVMFAMLM